MQLLIAKPPNCLRNEEVRNSFFYYANKRGKLSNKSTSLIHRFPSLFTKRPLGQLNEITTRSVKFSGINSHITVSENDKIVNNYFVGKIKILLNFPVKVVAKNKSSLKKK